MDGETAGTLTAVVPTRDRPEQLAAVAGHLLAQTRVPDELIVVDQSAAEDGRARVTALVAAAPAGRRPRLRYVRDPAVAGAAAARNLGLDLAGGDVVVCVDDDMVPEPDVLARLLDHLARDPGLAAVTPVITNYPPPPWPHRLLAWTFFRGPFRDERQPVYWRWRRHRGRLVPVGLLGAGMLAVRRSALGDLRFDPRYRGASPGEDIDLSWSLAARGGRLAIATDARVVHARPPRRDGRHEETLLTSWAFVVAKHRPPTPGTRLAFAWFVTGVLLGALLAAARSGRAAPLRSARAGLRSLGRDFAGSSFLGPGPAPSRADS